MKRRHSVAATHRFCYGGGMFVALTLPLYLGTRFSFIFGLNWNWCRTIPKSKNWVFGQRHSHAERETTNNKNQSKKTLSQQLFPSLLPFPCLLRGSMWFFFNNYCYFFDTCLFLEAYFFFMRIPSVTSMCVRKAGWSILMQLWSPVALFGSGHRTVHQRGLVVPPFPESTLEISNAEVDAGWTSYSWMSWVQLNHPKFQPSCDICKWMTPKHWCKIRHFGSIWQRPSFNSADVKLILQAVIGFLFAVCTLLWSRFPPMGLRTGMQVWLIDWSCGIAEMVVFACCALALVTTPKAPLATPMWNARIALTWANRLRYFEAVFSSCFFLGCWVPTIFCGKHLKGLHGARMGQRVFCNFHLTLPQTLLLTLCLHAGWRPA